MLDSAERKYKLQTIRRVFLPAIASARLSRRILSWNGIVGVACITPYMMIGKCSTKSVAEISCRFIIATLRKRTEDGWVVSLTAFWRRLWPGGF